MTRAHNELLIGLEDIVSNASDRGGTLHIVATLLRKSRNYRWVGLYDVDWAPSIVRNLAWSGASAPKYPTFPITRGLTGAAIAEKKTVNVGDVADDPRYLTAFPTTRSEIIVSVFNKRRKTVLGTIDHRE
jgi:putative methionine-R-sulfoxide reductase with GAF domain